MNRLIISIMFAVTTTFTCLAADAATARFCATWKTYIADWDAGDFLVAPPLPWPEKWTNLAAKYTSYVITKGSGHTWIADGHLDWSGCTPYIPITDGTYHFDRSSNLYYNGASVTVLLDGYAWGSGSPFAYETVEDDFMFRSPTGNTTVNTAPTAMTDQSRLMPMLAQVIFRGTGYLDLATTNDPVYIWVSTWFEDDRYQGDPGQCVTESTAHYAYPDEFEVCFANSSQHKFRIGHEIGHVISKHRDGAQYGVYEGSEGYFRDPVDGYDGSHNCDTSLIGNHMHDLTSREFTGAGQKEGFSQFIATAAMNDRVNDGEFILANKPVMNWSTTHGTYFPSVDPLVQDWDPPFPVDLSNSHYVKWMEYECVPPTWFEHFGTEWDWLDFFWNLWTYGSYKYSVAEINDIWHDTVTKNGSGDVTNNEIAYFCCSADDIDPDPDHEVWIPSACSERDKSAACGTSPNFGDFTHEFMVGKLWEDDGDFDVTKGLVDTAWTKYGVSNWNKYNLFVNTGDNAKVNY
jgi:hypothetical protein